MSSEKSESKETPKQESADNSMSNDQVQKENLELKQKLDQALAQLRQANGLLQWRDSEQKQADDIEKATFIVKYSRDRLKMNRQVLSALSLRQLRWLDKILTAYKLDAGKYMQQIAAQDQAGKIQRGLTVGEYDPKRKEWKTT